MYQFLVFLALKLSFDSLCNLKWANLPEIIIVQLHATEKSEMVFVIIVTKSMLVQE